MDPTMYHIAGRAGGKTTKLLRWVASQEKVGDIAVICHSDAEKERLTHLWMEQHPGQPQPRFITPTEARNGSLAGRHTRLAIDNLDILLQQLYGYPVHYVSATGERIG